MDEQAAIFKALSDPTRLAVLQCIRCCGGDCGYDTETGSCSGCTCEGVAVCSIRCQVPCAPSTLTHHLNELRAAGLITTEKRGRVVFCRINQDALARAASFLLSK